MKKVIFAGVRLESCRAFVGLMENYGYNVDIVTLDGSLIEKNKKEFLANTLVCLPYKKEFVLEYLYKIMTANKYDLLLSVGFPYILPRKFLKLDTLLINSHPHLLPGHKGNDCIRKSFARKEKEYGVTLHHISEKLDAGKIIYQKKIILNPVDINVIYSNLFSFIEPAAILEGLFRVIDGPEIDDVIASGSF